MNFVLIALVVLFIWVHLVGAGLAAWIWIRDYAVARVAGILGIVLFLFCVEHFVGFGPHPAFMVLTAPLSGWLIWRHRAVLKEHWQVEAMFGVGFFYCLIWRCAFPDIDLVAERIPDLVFIQDFMTGSRLPAPDRWLPPFDVGFYYGFQHYAAGLMGRTLGIGSGLTYQFAYCTVVGLMTGAVGSAARALCAWRPGPWLVLAAVLVGGNGVIVGLPALVKKGPEIFQSSRFLGFHVGDQEWNWLGRLVGWTFNSPPDGNSLEYPMDTFSYAIYVGEYHPPLMGFLLLALALLIMASLESGAEGARRTWLHALLAATLPLSLIGNIWVAPLQVVLVGLWCLYRALQGEKEHWWACIAGGVVAVGLAYPHLAQFSAQPILQHSSLKLTSLAERTPFGQWLFMFWPVLLLLVLAIGSRRRPMFALFLAVCWSLLLVLADVVFNDDGFGGTWNRYNSTLKWWPWIYAGITITVGAHNLASPSRLCRWGTVFVLALMCTFGISLGRHLVQSPKPSAMRLEGHHWMTQHPSLRDLVESLRKRPDGIALESSPVRGNSDYGVVSIFGGKSCFLGWVAHEEVLWRGIIPEITNRIEDIKKFYTNEMPDPLDWLARNDIRYILWLQRDNVEGNRHFKVLWEKIGSDYTWFRVLGDDKEWSIGYWERKPEPRSRTILVKRSGEGVLP